MSESVVATLNIPFDVEEDGIGDAAGNNKIVLQQMTRRLDVNGQLFARCFPASGVTFIASQGTVESGEKRAQIMYEALKFSDSSSVSLKFTGASGVVIDSSRTVLMRKTTDNYGHTRIVQANDITLRYDSESNAIVAESSGAAQNYQLKRVKVYGACFISYTATYRVLYYTPLVSGSSTKGYVFSIGSIFGYNDYTVEVLDMELDLSLNETEYARLYRKIVLTPDGAFEEPDGWPNQTTINGWELDPDNSFTDKIVKMIAYVNQAGAIRYERLDAPRLDDIPLSEMKYYWTIAQPSVEWVEIFNDVNEHSVETVFDLESGTSPLTFESSTPRSAK